MGDTAKIVALHLITADGDNQWAGSFLALYSDGSLARVETGDVDGVDSVCITPLKVVAKA